MYYKAVLLWADPDIAYVEIPLSSPYDADMISIEYQFEHTKPVLFRYSWTAEDGKLIFVETPTIPSPTWKYCVDDWHGYNG